MDIDPGTPNEFSRGENGYFISDEYEWRQYPGGMRKFKRLKE